MGEIRETLSTHVAIDNKCDVIISSWVHTPYHFNEEIGSLVNYGIPAICLQAIHLMIEKKIVSHRTNRMMVKCALDAVSQYMKEEKFKERFRHEIVGILEEKLAYRSNISLIDIHPKHEDYHLFLKSFFSLNSKTMSGIIERGRERTMEVFQERAWELP